MSWPIIPAGETYALPGQAVWRAHCRTVPALAICEAQPRPIEGTTWRLECPGIYYWNRKPDHGLVLAYPADPFARLRLVFDLIVASTYYLNGPDSADFNADPLGYTMSMLGDPRVSDLGCGQRSNAMIYLLAEMGLAARPIQWLGLEPVDGGHIASEVDLGEPWGWTAVDAFYGLIFPTGWDALDVFQFAQTGADPARRLVHFQDTTEGLEWTRMHPPESMYARYNGAIGWGTLPGTTTYPLYLGAGATIEAMGERGGISNPVAFTEQQVRETWYP